MMARGRRLPVKQILVVVWLVLVTVTAGCSPALAPSPTLTVTTTPAPTPALSPNIPPLTETSVPGTNSMKIRLRLENAEITATLIESKSTQDFISLLPLTLTLEDYAGIEKISDLPKRLNTEGAPAGSDPSVGDITYYAPWGNLAIFYRDFGYASGLIILGKIDSGIEVLSVPGPVKVTIELIE